MEKKPLPESSANTSLESLYVPNISKSTYRPSHLDGSLAIPRSPRRVMPKQAKSKFSFSQTSDHNGNTTVKEEDEYLPDEEEEDQQEVTIDPTHVDPYLQALSVTRFLPGVFFVEFFGHLFMPVIVLIYIWTKEGRIYLSNRGFISFSFNYVLLVQWFNFAIMIYLHLLYFWIKPPDFSLSELLLIDGLMVFRFLVIATKYGYTSPLEHREMKERLETYQQKADRQVITGWSLPSENSVETQILLASVRQKLDLNLSVITAVPVLEDQDSSKEKNFHEAANLIRARFTKYELDPKEDGPDTIRKTAEIPIKQKDESSLPRPAEKLLSNELIKSSSMVEPNTQQEIKFTAWDLTKSLVISSHDIKVQFWICWIVTILQVVIPPLTRSLRGGHWAYGPAITAKIGFFFNFFYTVSSVATTFIFIMIAITDMHRREFLQKRMNAIGYDGYVLDPLGSGRKLRIHMDDLSNLTSWWFMRIVLQDYGLQYYKRVTAYTGFFFVYALLLVVLVAVAALTSGTLDPAVVGLVTLDFVYIFGCISMVLKHGEETNKARAEHAMTMVRKRFDLESTVVSRAEKKKANKKMKDLSWDLEGLRNVLDTLITAIRLDNDFFSVTILGFKASGDLIRASIAVLASGLAATVKIFLGF